MQLLSIMLNVIGPIFLVVGAAYLIGKQFKPNPRGLSVFLIYLFVPALVFQGIYETELTGGEIGGIAGVVVGVAFVMMLVGLGIARLLNYSEKSESALVLTLILVNAANYGIPLNTFAFGDQGESTAIVYYVISAILGNILGVYFASRGSVPAREALLNVFKVPIGYAALLGLAANLADIELPTIIQRGIIDLAAGAAIPGMLALLGLQLSRVSLRPSGNFTGDAPSLATDLKAVLLASGLRLMMAPGVAVGLAFALGLSGTTFNVAVVESSMPTAVLASALATEFGADAKYVSAVTLVSTLLSVITLSVLIMLLGGTVA
jgi:hypothetical protein